MEDDGSQGALLGGKAYRSSVSPFNQSRSVLASPTIPLPPLQRIIETPVFGKSGRLLNAPGYHETDQLYYAAISELSIPSVPPEPTPEQIQDATRLLLEEFLGDFPFVNDSDRRSLRASDSRRE